MSLEFSKNIKKREKKTAWNLGYILKFIKNKKHNGRKKI